MSICSTALNKELLFLITFMRPNVFSEGEACDLIQYLMLVMLNAEVLFLCMTDDSQVPSHAVAGYATVATTGDAIRRLVGVI